MARIRSIKPEFWDDRKLARSTSRDARMLYQGLWNQADEHARCNGDLVWLKGRVFPYEDDISTDVLEKLLAELILAGRVERYVVDGDPYLFLPKLGKHQRLEPDKVQSKLPDPSAAQIFSDKSAPDANPPGKKSLLYVAGSMEHVSAPSAEKPPPKKPTPTSTDPDFIAFWNVYPRKSSKPDAVKAYFKARDKAGVSVILEGAQRFLADPNREDEFTPHAATWLNGERWNDPPLPARKPSRPAAAASGGGW